MAEEAAALLADLDYVLEKGAVEPDVRQRLLEIRAEIEHVRQTGHFRPVGQRAEPA